MRWSFRRGALRGVPLASAAVRALGLRCAAALNCVLAVRSQCTRVVIASVFNGEVADARLASTKVGIRLAAAARLGWPNVTSQRKADVALHGRRLVLRPRARRAMQ